MQCCPCSGPTTTISALFTDAPNSIDISISEINTIDYEDVTDQTTFLSGDDNLDDNLVTTTEFEGLYMKLLLSIIVIFIHMNQSILVLQLVSCHILSIVVRD